MKAAKALEERAPEVIPGSGFAFGEAARTENNQQTVYALVVVTYNFRHLPRLSDKTKEVAMALFESLVGSSFNRFSHRGSKLLINPSVVEFQDSMSELERICAQEVGSSFFLFISVRRRPLLVELRGIEVQVWLNDEHIRLMQTHGARVSGGPNAGSYMLFGETRLSSEGEFLLTAVHLHELARMVHGTCRPLVMNSGTLCIALCTHARHYHRHCPDVMQRYHARASL